MTSLTPFIEKILKTLEHPPCGSSLEVFFSTLVLFTVWPEPSQSNHARYPRFYLYYGPEFTPSIHEDTPSELFDGMSRMEISREFLQLMRAKGIQELVILPRPLLSEKEKTQGDLQYQIEELLPLL